MPIPTPRGRDYLLALGLCAASVGVLGLAQRDQGVMRDEATYFEAGERYWGWFADLADNLAAGRTKNSFSARSLATYWAVNNEHPVLCKVLFGISWRVFHGAKPTPAAKAATGVAAGSWSRWSGISAFRLPGWLFVGLAAAILYLFGVRIESRLAGLGAALLYVTLPHVFFHGQLAAFDSPIATMWLLTVYAYVRSLERARWGILAGIIFGLTLATKHNAWFLPPLLLLHYLVVVRPDLSLRPLQLPRIPLAFVAMLFLGPLVFWAHWPWLWFDTVNHLKGYFGFHLHHSYYNIEYLGRNLGQPPLPMSYPFVMTLFTVPTLTLLLGIAGLWLYARVPITTVLSRWIGVRPPPLDDRFRFAARRGWLRPGLGLDPRLGLLFAINVAFPLLLIAHPKTPHFGGTKHWLTAYPFLALLAGVALSRLGALVREALPRLGTLASALLILCTPLPGVLAIAFSHPYGLSQYNALAGGAAGGADLGLVRQFWGYPSRQLLPTIDKLVPRGASVYWHDTSPDSTNAYVRDGLLRPDVLYAGPENRAAIDASSWAMVMHELHFNKYDYWIWDAYGTGVPVTVLHLDGVPVLSFYKRPR